MQKVKFSERLHPPFGLFLALLLGYPMVLLAAMPFGLPIALVASGLLPSVVIVTVFLLSPQVTVSDRLVAGRYLIPLSAIGQVDSLDSEEFGRLLGPGFNPRARLMLGGFSKTGVRIEIVDPADPTPYVLVSSRKPQELARALGADRS